MDRLHVATLNMRNIADRWAGAQRLLYADMAALQPDLIGLQEAVSASGQDRLSGPPGEGATTRRVHGWAGRPEYGNSVLVALATAPARTSSASTSACRGLRRRVRVALPRGATPWSWP